MKDCLFKHHSVNHSKTFKDPETGACTNLIEGAWRAHLKSKISVQNYRKFQLGKYIHRRMWTKKTNIVYGIRSGKFWRISIMTKIFQIYAHPKGELDRQRIAKAWGVDKTRFGAEKMAQWLFRTKGKKDQTRGNEGGKKSKKGETRIATRRRPNWTINWNCWTGFLVRERTAKKKPVAGQFRGFRDTRSNRSPK